MGEPTGCCYPEDPNYRYADDCYDIETESDCDKFSRRSGCRWTTNCGAAADGVWSQWYGPDGKSDGTHYTLESSSSPDSIATICVRTYAGQWVAAIKTTFNSGTTSGWVGGRHTDESCFTLDTDEYIVGVLVRAGQIIDALQFTTTL